MKFTTLTAVGAAASLALAATASADQGVSKSEIKIGTHTALTGPVAPWGVGSVNGIRMRFEEENKKGGVHGRKLTFIAEDHAYQVPRAVQAANKLLNRDKIFIMLAALGTPQNNAVMKRQLRKGVMSFAPFTAARSMSEPFHKLKFTALSSYYTQIRAGVKYFVEQKGRKKVCSMYQDTDFGREILIGTQDQLKAMNMKMVLAVGHKPRDTDFTGTITRMRAAGCDLITMGTIIRDAIIPYATARKLGWKNVDFLASVASYSMIVAAKLKGLDGLYAMTSFQLIYPGAPGNSKGQEDWAAAYKARYGRMHNGAAQLGYIYADVLIHALKNAGKDLTMAKLVDALESTQGYVTKLGNAPISFSKKSRQGATQSTLAVVKGGRWMTITKPIGY